MLFFSSIPAPLRTKSCPSKSYTFKFKTNSAEARNRHGIIQQKYCQLDLKGTEWSKADGLLAFYRMGPSGYTAASMCYPSRKGKNQWEGDSEIIRATVATTGPDYTGPGRGWGVGRMPLPLKGWSHCHSFNLPGFHHPEPWALGKRATSQVDPEGGAPSQKLSPAVLGSNGMCFTGFWTHLGLITPYFFPISPFWRGNVYPTHVLPLYFRSIFWFQGFTAGADKLYFQPHPYLI